jgi:hypothetical protein
MKYSILVCAALVGMCTNTFAAESVKINAMWATSSPGVPEGLKIACVTNGKTLHESRTCPVVRYQGMSTWAYSYIDNRVSLAMVTYDSDGKVVRNVEHKGARYVAKMVGDPKGQTVTISGEENATVTIPWSELGK